MQKSAFIPKWDKPEHSGTAANEKNALIPKRNNAHQRGSPLSREIVYCLSMAVKITQREEKR